MSERSGKFVGKVDGGKVQADCGAVTANAEQILHAKAVSI